MRLMLGIVDSLLTLYSILLVIRIFLSWFGGQMFGRGFGFLSQITDPYLNWFRRFRFLRAGMFDFSPIVALAVISVAGSVVQQISAWGRVSIGLVLALLVQAVWSAMSFLLLFVLAALVIRFVGYLIRANVHSVFWRVIDSICNSVLYRLNSIIFRRRAVNYMASLLIGIAVCAGAYFVIDYLVGLLMAALIQPAFFFG